jgi:hypothetical protein
MVIEWTVVRRWKGLAVWYWRRLGCSTGFEHIEFGGARQVEEISGGNAVLDIYIIHAVPRPMTSKWVTTRTGDQTNRTWTLPPRHV